MASSTVCAAIAIAAALSACAHVPQYRPMSDYPGLSEATTLACAAVEMPGACPTVHVIDGARLTCRNSPGEQMAGFGCKGVVHPGCVCAAGQSDSRWDHMDVAIVPGQRPHETAVCHEADHMSLGRRTGDEHGDHAPPFYAIDSACREKLRAAGY